MCEVYPLNYALVQASPLVPLSLFRLTYEPMKVWRPSHVQGARLQSAHNNCEVVEIGVIDG